MNNKIKIWNNGRGIPVVEHKEHNMFVPSLIFGHLLTSSNYDDTEKKVTGKATGLDKKKKIQRKIVNFYIPIIFSIWARI